jgi:hypothetical protein
MIRLARASALIVVTTALAGCDKQKQPVAPDSTVTGATDPRFTAASGSVSTLLGRGHFSGPLSVTRQTGPWTFNATGQSLDVAVQNIVFAPGGQSGWHRHPGPVFILVVEGTMTFYESDDPSCTPIVKTAGHGYLDAGDHAHIARNETQVDARNVVTYFAPPGATLRIDMPSPGNCPF